jgi:hypothetical protein
MQRGAGQGAPARFGDRVVVRASAELVGQFGPVRRRVRRVGSSGQRLARAFPASSTRDRPRPRAGGDGPGRYACGAGA